MIFSCRRRPPDLGAHLDAQLGVEVRQRLIEQQHLGLDDQRARDGDPLQLAAGELVRPALLVAVEMDELQRPGDAALDVGGRDVARPEAVGDVAADRVVGKDRVVLEHHAGVAPVRRQLVDVLLAEQDPAVVQVAEARDHAE